MYLPLGTDVERAVEFAPLQSFLGALKADAGFDLASVTVPHIEYFGLNPETAPIGFMMARANVKAKVPQKAVSGAVEGGAIEMAMKPVPSVAFLRGPAVDVFVVLRVADGPEAGQQFFVGVRQPRVPRGKRAALELPAGMWKPADGTYRMVASAEALQEIGIRFGPEDLHDMSEIQEYEMRQALAARPQFKVIDEDLKGPFGLEPSIGGCDEIVRKFALRWTISSADLALLNGRLEGLAEEREHICTTLLPLQPDSALYYTDAKILSSLALYSACETAERFKAQDRRIVAAGGPLAAVAAARDGDFVPVRFQLGADGKLNVEKLQ